jgi:uncharacterized repeat protein (TIGR03803 family)
MTPRRQFLANRIRFLSLVTAILFCATWPASAQFSTLYHFGRSTNDAVQPQGGLIADKAGNLYGTTAEGGTFGAGTVFELSPPATFGPWTETVLYNFNGSEGLTPLGGLVFDSAGNLYGTTSQGGAFQGTVFELEAPVSGSGTWTYKVLYNFLGDPDGDLPNSGLTIDEAGNLYGTTLYGGPCANGTVFELSPPTVEGAAWTETILHAFRFYCAGKVTNDGNSPYGPLLFSGGSLYGTTFDGGGATAAGIIFKLSPPAAGETTWREQILYTFTGGADGGYSTAGLVLRGNNLYGTTQYGGNVAPCSNGNLGCGVVFELSPPAAGGSAWTETPVYSFINGSDGSLPSAPVLFDPSGNLYTSTSLGGSGTCNFIDHPGCGAVIKLAPPAAGSTIWTETTLHSFTGSKSGDQGADISGLIVGRNQKLYGTTGTTNMGGEGTVFSVVP